LRWSPRTHQQMPKKAPLLGRGIIGSASQPSTVDHCELAALCCSDWPLALRSELDGTSPGSLYLQTPPDTITRISSPSPCDAALHIAARPTFARDVRRTLMAGCSKPWPGGPLPRCGGNARASVTRAGPTASRAARAKPPPLVPPAMTPRRLRATTPRTFAFLRRSPQRRGVLPATLRDWTCGPYYRLREVLTPLPGRVAFPGSAHVHWPPWHPAAVRHADPRIPPARTARRRSPARSPPSSAAVGDLVWGVPRGRTGSTVGLDCVTAYDTGPFPPHLPLYEALSKAARSDARVRTSAAWLCPPPAPPGQTCRLQ